MMKPFTAALPARALLILCFIASLQVYGQQNNPLINSGEVIAEGTRLHEKGEYKEAIKKYLSINRSDTSYADVVHEISLSYYADSQFNKAIEFAKLGMKLFPLRYNVYSMLAANALDELNQRDEALVLYDSAIKRNPHNFLLYFNKGIVLYKMKNYAAAKTNMQQCLLINPFYSSAHYFMGTIYLLEGNLVASMLAFQTYLLMTPAGKYQGNAVNYMNEISKVTDEVDSLAKAAKKSKEDDFSIQQEILVSKLALDAKYKLKADIEDNIVRQMQVINEKLEYVKNDRGFAMQFYVPIYEQTMKDDEFETLVFSAFAEINNDRIASWIKKNDRKRTAYASKASDYFSLIKRNRILNFTERQQSNLVYAYDDGKFIGKGSFTPGENPVYYGKWEYYYETGGVKAVGVFNDKGEKHGPWIYYHENGAVKEKSNSQNGVADGLVEGWFDNGNRWYQNHYKDGKLNGIQKYYYFNGHLSNEYNTRDELKNGEEKTYSVFGVLTAVDTYVDDKLDGWSRGYYPNGKVKAEVKFKNDNEEGEYKSYFASGKLQVKGNLTNGLRQGLWTTYYENGIVADKTTYVDGNILGEYTEYHENGQLKQKGNYYNKKVDGKIEYFDDDAVRYCDATYEKGKLREIVFYDKQGKTVSTTTTRKGAANIVFYTAEGIKTGEGYFTRDGEKDGKYTNYYHSGMVSEVSNWKDGVLNGEMISYYADGKIKKKTNYNNGQEDGYVIDYYANGKISAEGWRVNGNRQQQYLYYNNLGELTTTEYFLNDDLDGYVCYYDPGNILNAEYFYDNGWRETIRQVDKNGATISESNFEKGGGRMIFKHTNGKISSDASYRHYHLNGVSDYYFFDGSKSATAFYKNDNRDSIYRGYHFGGKLSAEGSFLNGAKSGHWKYFDTNGQLTEEEIYGADTDTMLNKLYFPNGDPDRIIRSKVGELHGPYDIYGENGQLAVRLIYKEGLLLGYQYEDKPGSLIPMIKIPGGSGKIVGKYTNGKTSVEFEFAESLLENMNKTYYANGNKYVEGGRLQGYRHGSFKVYHPNGNLWEDENYVLGNLNGKCKYYHANGKLQREENYYNDDLHGESKIFDENGQLKQSRTYHYGILTSVK